MGWIPESQMARTLQARHTHKVALSEVRKASKSKSTHGPVQSTLQKHLALGRGASPPLCQPYLEVPCCPLCCCCHSQSPARLEATWLFLSSFTTGHKFGQKKPAFFFLIQMPPNPSPTLIYPGFRVFVYP